eukprot:SAG25_NODE_3284_length_1145_cov_116.133843_3_plen_79_part_01
MHNHSEECNVGVDSVNVDTLLLTLAELHHCASDEPPAQSLDDASADEDDSSAVGCGVGVTSCAVITSWVAALLAFALAN